MNTAIRFVGGLGITPKEGAVIERLSYGDTNKVAARKLHVAPSTIKAHIDSARRRTGAVNATHLVSICWQNRALVCKQACLIIMISTNFAANIPGAADHQQPPVRMMRTARVARTKEISPFS